MELTARDYYTNGDFQQNYLHITLTDEQDVPDAMGRLRSIYPYLMLLDYDNARTVLWGRCMTERRRKSSRRLMCLQNFTAAKTARI